MLPKGLAVLKRRDIWEILFEYNDPLVSSFESEENMMIEEVFNALQQEFSPSRKFKEHVSPGEELNGFQVAWNNFKGRINALWQLYGLLRALPQAPDED